MYELRHYESAEGKDLFALWLESLRDRHAQARVVARLIRLQNGNFGDCKPVGDGVWELRVTVETNGHKSRTYVALSDVGLNGKRGVRNENRR